MDGKQIEVQKIIIEEEMTRNYYLLIDFIQTIYNKIYP